MVVLHVIAAMDPEQGGVSQAVRGIIIGLQGEGVASEVVSLDAPEASFLAEFNNLAPIHAKGPGKGPWCYSTDLYQWLCNNVHQYDAIIVHGLWLYPGYAVRKALRHVAKDNRRKSAKSVQLPKLFVMPHGMLDPYFQQATSRKLKAWRNRIYWKLIENKIVNSANALLFTCEEECRLASKTFSPYHPQAVSVVGLGVEKPPEFTPAMHTAFEIKSPALGNIPYLLFLSRIHEKKGLGLLLDAYGIMVKKAKSSGLIAKSSFPKLVIAGPGLETDYGKHIQQLVTSRQELLENVYLTGMLTGNAKWGAFYGCEAFILPSYQENFGIAVVEALACQKPVLISNQVNIWREIEGANGGLIALPNSEAILALFDSWNQLSKEKRDKMKKGAGTLFKNAFAIDAAAKKMVAALQQTQFAGTLRTD